MAQPWTVTKCCIATLLRHACAHVIGSRRRRGENYRREEGATSCCVLRMADSRFAIPLDCPQNQEELYPYGPPSESSPNNRSVSEEFEFSPEKSPGLFPPTPPLLRGNGPYALARAHASRNLLESFSQKSGLERMSRPTDKPNRSSTSTFTQEPEPVTNCNRFYSTSRFTPRTTTDSALTSIQATCKKVTTKDRAPFTNSQIPNTQGHATGSTARDRAPTTNSQTVNTHGCATASATRDNALSQTPNTQRRATCSAVKDSVYSQTQNTQRRATGSATRDNALSQTPTTQRCVTCSTIKDSAYSQTPNTQRRVTGSATRGSAPSQTQNTLCRATCSAVKDSAHSQTPNTQRRATGSATRDSAHSQTPNTHCRATGSAVRDITNSQTPNTPVHTTGYVSRDRSPVANSQTPNIASVRENRAVIQDCEYYCRVCVCVCVCLCMLIYVSM